MFFFHFTSLPKKQKSQNTQSSQKKPETNFENENEETMSFIESSSSSSSSSTSSISSNKFLAAKTTTKSSESQQKQTISPPLAQISIEDKPKHYNALVRSNKVENGGGELRYTPAALEQLLNAGLNHLDVLNLSALQLEELDKVRCIGVAQQETVALAHLIKRQKSGEQQAEQVKIITANSLNRKAYDETDKIG